MRSGNKAVCTSEGSLYCELESSAWLHWLYRFAELRAQSGKTSFNDWREHPWRPPSQSTDMLRDGWGCLSIEQVTGRQGQVRQKALTGSSSCQEVSTTTLMPVLDNNWLHKIIFPLKNKVFFIKKKVYDNTLATKPEPNLGKTVFIFYLSPFV